MYLSIIKLNGLHKSSNKEFKFVEPSKSNKELKSLYDDFNKFIKSKDKPVTFSEIYDLFSQQPYGVKKGLIPILIAVFFMTNEGSYALYNTDEKNKEYLITEYDKRILERFIHTPETMKIMFVKIEGEKQKLLEEFKIYIESKYLSGKKIENPTPLNILNLLLLEHITCQRILEKQDLLKIKELSL